MYAEMQTINSRTTRFFKSMKQLASDHYSWLKAQKFGQTVTSESRIEKHSVGGSRRASRRTSHMKEITLDNLVQRVEEKRRKVNKQQPNQATS